jgi:CheY-like chemotaxis protein
LAETNSGGSNPLCGANDARRHLDGRRVAAAVKTSSAATPVILLTGWGQRLVDENEIPMNVDRVLNKPPKLRELRAALAELVMDARCEMS